jgi:hypothetical protein
MIGLDIITFYQFTVVLRFRGGFGERIRDIADIWRDLAVVVAVLCIHIQYNMTIKQGSKEPTVPCNPPL